VRGTLANSTLPHSDAVAIEGYVFSSPDDHEIGQLTSVDEVATDLFKRIKANKGEATLFGTLKENWAQPENSALAKNTRSTTGFHSLQKALRIKPKSVKVESTSHELSAESLGLTEIQFNILRNNLDRLYGEDGYEFVKPILNKKLSFGKLLGGKKGTGPYVCAVETKQSKAKIQILSHRMFSRLLPDNVEMFTNLASNAFGTIGEKKIKAKGVKLK
jgi:hypothetical protein